VAPMDVSIPLQLVPHLHALLVHATQQLENVLILLLPAMMEMLVQMIVVIPPLAAVNMFLRTVLILISV
jgi:hypothetical protein